MKHRCEICGGLTHKKLLTVTIAYRGEVGACESCMDVLSEIIRKLQNGGD